MSGRKCRNCGSSDIEVDSARGDAVCTSCGSVLEDNIIVAEIQFEENAHGSSSAIGQFVSSESKGGATSYGSSFHVSIGTESREVTLRRARSGITQLCQQLRLNNHCIDTACNFFKMALSRHLTRGRKMTHMHAACVYITCRTEGTAHLLIDISDVLQICCYELGRTYLRISQALCINIPSIDPCLYILRFANRLEFGDKTHEVSMTALRLVQRMKRDNIHSGRRPSGLCGAALLIAARMHEFNRSPSDIIRIVKVHESTLRKRLLEFGDTPSSALTLEEFMSVDLEADQDPPSFKAARKKDKERLGKLFEEEHNDEFTELQKEIDRQLERDLKGAKKRKAVLPADDVETADTTNFINESTLGAIQNCLENSPSSHESEITPEPDTVALPTSLGLGPDIASIILPPPLVDDAAAPYNASEHDFKDIDDDEIDSYIMTSNEAKHKNGLWTKLNAGYLEDQKARELKLAKEKEEGKPERKKRKNNSKKKSNIGPSNSAGEAIEKMLQEKKISNKINYDILKSLNVQKTEPSKEVVEEEKILTTISLSPSKSISKQPNLGLASRKKIASVGLPVVESPLPMTAEPVETETASEVKDLDDEADYYDAEPEPEPVHNADHASLASMLYNTAGQDEEYYGYDDY